MLTPGNVIYRSVVAAGHQTCCPAGPEDIDAVYELRAGTSAEPGLVGTHQGVFFNEKVHCITE
ncbi:hypothetical protein ECDEC13D_4741 [Escherichia coli DEC13D]|nr:hypothetical protein ECDEC13D_4741 [Escherichia coli DEC13D]